MTRPVFEPTTQRQIRKQGFSADQLFRRPAPTIDAAGTLPVAWSKGTSATLTDGEGYGLMQLVGADPFWWGLVDLIAVGNDPADGTAVFDLYNNDRLQVYTPLFGRRYVFQIEAGASFSEAIGGEVNLFMDQDGMAGGPTIHVIDHTITGTTLNPYSLRLAATIVYSASVKPGTPSSSFVFQPVLRNFSGDDLSITQSWCVLTMLTIVDDTVEVTV